MSRFYFPLAGAALAALSIEGCSSAASLLYMNKNTQAIRHDTITSSGTVTATQNPQDAVNGTIRMTPVERVELQRVQLQAPAGSKKPFDVQRTLMVPPGFQASVYAADLGTPRDLALRDDGTLFYSNIDAGQIVALSPDGKRTIIAQGLQSPHGIELHNNALYYTDETHVYRFDFSSPTALDGKSTMLTDKIPTGSTNYTRTIRWSAADKRFYISVGSTSNKSLEASNENAAILRMGENGGPLSVTMRGVRNAVGMDIHPESGELWATDAGTEFLSFFIPPEEINIMKVGAHYGWPYYYGENFRDPDYMGPDSANAPRNAVPPVVQLPAHSSPLDLHFYTGSALGPAWRNSMLVTLHGSMNIVPATGYKVVRVQAAANGSNARVADLVTGFIDAEGSAWGRPVGIAISKDGNTFYISDDRAAAIYKVYKQP